LYEVLAREREIPKIHERTTEGDNGRLSLASNLRDRKRVARGKCLGERRTGPLTDAYKIINMPCLTETTEDINGRKISLGCESFWGSSCGKGGQDFLTYH